MRSIFLLRREIADDLVSFNSLTYFEWLYIDLSLRSSNTESSEMEREKKKYCPMVSSVWEWQWCNYIKKIVFFLPFTRNIRKIESFSVVNLFIIVHGHNNNLCIALTRLFELLSFGSWLMLIKNPYGAVQFRSIETIVMYWLTFLIPEIDRFK